MLEIGDMYCVEKTTQVGHHEKPIVYFVDTFFLSYESCVIIHQWS